MLEINPIERIGMNSRIYQIQQRISNIQEQFQVDKFDTGMSADKVSADFQSKLDKEIERQDKIDATKNISENKATATLQDTTTKNNSSRLSSIDEEIISAAKVIVALASGNAAAPNVALPTAVEKNFTDENKNKNPKQNFSQENNSTEDLINTSARRNGVDPSLVRAVAIAESDMNQEEISPVGAIGVMQLMPETAAALGVNPYDKAQNIEGGTRYLRQMLDQFGGNVPHALAAYNAGPAAVKKYGGIPPYRETQNYVGRIMDIVSG